jgi:RNA polymerase sigma-70 factor (ECF subfamily)
VSDASQPSDRSALTADDRRLVEACVAGEADAWEALVDRFGRLLAHVASRTARQRGLSLAAADREDLVAEVLVELLRNDAATLRGFAGRSSLSTYLAVIARRVAARRLGDVRPAGSRHAAEARPRRPDDDARRAEREHVEALLAGLNDDEARLVRLHHIEQRSYGEISHLTGMPLGSIGPALSRARDKMRRADQNPDEAGDGRMPSRPSEPAAGRTAGR